MGFGVRALAGGAAVALALLANGAGATVPGQVGVIGYGWGSCAGGGRPASSRSARTARA